MNGQDNKVKCNICLEIFEPSATILLACGHNWCRGCITNRFEAAVQHQHAFPPSCCAVDTEIPFTTAYKFLDVDLCRRYADKRVELTTPDPIYCAVPACSSFIPPSHIISASTIANCPRCAANTCARCKGLAHGGTACTHDLGAAALRETARAAGWQACYRCQSIVEQVDGCDHMTCLCGAEFCYLCGNVWGTCNCEDLELGLEPPQP